MNSKKYEELSFINQDALQQSLDAVKLLANDEDDVIVFSVTGIHHNKGKISISYDGNISKEIARDILEAIIEEDKAR